ncbi:hypothetical protein ACS0TY_027748 [Phlomoides rotata]
MGARPSAPHPQFGSDPDPTVATPQSYDRDEPPVPAGVSPAPNAWTRPSYLEALHKSKSVPTPALDNTITPVRKGNFFSVHVDESLYKSAVQGLRGTLIGRLIYEKKVTPLSMESLERKLTELWGTSRTWRLIPLGKGYFNIRFSSKDDRDRILKRRTWSVKLGLMRLQHWVLDFDPDKIKSSVTQVWIRIHGLPIEYWQNQVLWAMTLVIGTPIMIDERTKTQSMCRYARMLVEFDLKQPREERIMFERAGHSSFATVKYEQLSVFCVICGNIGHTASNCHRQVGSDSAPEPTVVPPPMGTNIEWVRTGPVAETEEEALWDYSPTTKRRSKDPVARAEKKAMTDTSKGYNLRSKKPLTVDQTVVLNSNNSRSASTPFVISSADAQFLTPGRQGAMAEMRAVMELMKPP